MEKEFKSVMINEITKLLIDLNYPRVSKSTRYNSEIGGTFNRLEDEIKLKTLVDLLYFMPEEINKEVMREIDALVKSKTTFF